MADRVTQEVELLVVGGASNARVTQEVELLVVGGASNARVTQAVVMLIVDATTATVARRRTPDEWFNL